MIFVQEVLAVYLQHFPDSTVAINLKACNHFRLYNGKAAEAELKNLSDVCSPSFKFASDLIKHNLVRFIRLHGHMFSQHFYTDLSGLEFEIMFAIHSILPSSQFVLQFPNQLRLVVKTSPDLLSNLKFVSTLRY